ncbi:uncharacterized protein [Diadema setosum]|uniref:uncharacterized protein n=1 Tax=Diadema setosum TaxID=31175 RepID=UPI003B3AEA79
MAPPITRRTSTSQQLPSASQTSATSHSSSRPHGSPQQAATTHPEHNREIMTELKSMFTQFSTEFHFKFDKVISDLSEMKNDVAAMKVTINDLETSASDTSTRISTLESEKIPEIEHSIDSLRMELEDKLVAQEIHLRKQNLLFYGIPSQPNEDVHEVLTDTVSKLLDISTEEATGIPYVNIHRLPRKRSTNQAGNSSTTDAPDPIIARFVRMSDRDRILRAFEQPRLPQQPRETSGNLPATRQVTVRTDLPPRMKRERGRLATVAYDLRKNRHLKTRISIQGTKVLLMTKKPDDPSGNWKQWSE